MWPPNSPSDCKRVVQYSRYSTPHEYANVSY